MRQYYLTEKKTEERAIKKKKKKLHDKRYRAKSRDGFGWSGGPLTGTLNTRYTLCRSHTVELQWLEHLWDYENLFEAGVVFESLGFIIEPGQEA